MYGLVHCQWSEMHFSFQSNCRECRQGVYGGKKLPKRPLAKKKDTHTHTLIHSSHMCISHASFLKTTIIPPGKVKQASNPTMMPPYHNGVMLSLFDRGLHTQIQGCHAELSLAEAVSSPGINMGNHRPCHAMPSDHPGQQLLPCCSYAVLA